MNPAPSIPTGLPDLDAIDQQVFDVAAAHMSDLLDRRQFGYLEFAPGDATMYRILMAGPLAGGAYLFASNFGSLYQWGPANSDYTDPTYCQSHFVSDGAIWTASVYSRFLNTLRPMLLGR